MADFTVKQLAAIERVTERTVRNWISKGAIQIRRTPGGRIRIPDPRGGGVVFISMQPAEDCGNAAK